MARKRYKFNLPQAKVNRILAAICQVYDIGIDDLLRRTGSWECVMPRNCATFVMRQDYNLSYQVIAHNLERKDHTTAMHMVAQVENDPEMYEADLEMIRALLAETGNKIVA